MAQMFQDNVVGLDHRFEAITKVAFCEQRPLVVTYHLVSFLYFTRCGMMESCPSLRILSFS
jgi:hypothetical protein